MGDTIDSTAIVKPLLELYGQDLEIEWVTKPNLELLFKYDFRITPIILRFTNLPLLINIGKLKIMKAQKSSEVGSTTTNMDRTGAER